ncbi:MAG: hypothetical protein ABI792_04245 [bacterium]
MAQNLKSQFNIQRKFRQRIIITSIIAILIFGFSISIGIIGYHFFAHLPWVDAFLNASMILGGMGPVDILDNNTAKIFSGCYALFSGVTFISSMAIFLTPLIHWFLHKFHADIEDAENN